MFGRDVEPAIIRARDTLMTREKYRSYSSNDYIYRHDVGDQALYSLISRTYDFDEHDPARVRKAFDVELKPLAFDFREHVYEDDGRGSDTVLAWTSERYGVTVHIMVSESWLTSMNYSRDTCAAMERPLIPRNWRIFRDVSPNGLLKSRRGLSPDGSHLGSSIDNEGGRRAIERRPPCNPRERAASERQPFRASDTTCLAAS